MFFKRITPAEGLQHIIDCYWMAEDEDATVRQQKIIPDGFTEIIFHFGDPYRIKLQDEWQVQSSYLLAGQIRNHFFLENTGASGMIGIKLQPAALTHLYQLPMYQLTGQVADLHTALGNRVTAMQQALYKAEGHDEKIAVLNNYFQNLPAVQTYTPTAADHALKMIFAHHGMVPVATICQAVGIGERQLENLFRKYVGLSPKFFARIIRFNYIFQLVQENNDSWSGLAYEAAYYDQSHFIRNFKDFTGENPSGYAFDEKNLANFFLQKK